MRPVGSVGSCRHNFENNTISGASGIINAGIILILLQYNAVVFENCEKCMQIVPAATRCTVECTKLIKVEIV